MTGAAEKLDRGTTMAEMWDGFAQKVIPFAAPGTVQYQEMRKAFYSGALVLFNWFMVQLDEGTEPTDADMSRVGTIDAEIHAFFEDLGKGQPH